MITWPDPVAIACDLIEAGKWEYVRVRIVQTDTSLQPTPLGGAAGPDVG